MGHADISLFSRLLGEGEVRAGLGQLSQGTVAQPQLLIETVADRVYLQSQPRLEGCQLLRPLGMVLIKRCVPGLGGLVNLNPDRRGRGGLIGGGGAQEPVEPGTESGIGDLRLAATYSVDTGGPLGVDLTANAKIATADEDKGLGTGANDYGVAVDLYRDFSGTLLFGGVGYTVLGDSDFIDVGSVFTANVGASWRAGEGSLGLMYDYRQPASDDADDRSEITGFYSFPTGERTKMQVYAVGGLSDGSPDWGAGLSLSTGF